MTSKSEGSDIAPKVSSMQATAIPETAGFTKQYSISDDSQNPFPNEPSVRSPIFTITCLLIDRGQNLIILVPRQWSPYVLLTRPGPWITHTYRYMYMATLQHFTCSSFWTPAGEAEEPLIQIRPEWNTEAAMVRIRAEAMCASEDDYASLPEVQAKL